MKRQKNRPIICFDSSICINRARGNYSEADWSLVWKHVANNYEYAIMPPVVSELTVGVAKGDGIHFEKNRTPLKTLSPTHRKTMLDDPGAFAIRTVLNRETAGGLSPETYRRQISIVLQARDMRTLTHGVTQLTCDKNYEYGMDFGLLLGPMNKGKHTHITTLQEMRDGKKIAPPTKNIWAFAWAALFGIQLEISECAKMANALDAAYTYQTFLWNEALNGEYKFENHDTDWIDSNLLYYLANPDLHIVVSDSKLQRRIAPSPQSARVHDFREFASEIRPKAMAASL